MPATARKYDAGRNVAPARREKRSAHADAETVPATVVAHRNDIDGLRALAVLPVIFYHLKMPFNHGGYLGVDVFFVISGYLITSIIQADLCATRFSLLRFYERRARRIFPTLFAVLAACALFGCFELFAGEFERLGKSIVATTLFVSNFYFYSQSNYFGAASDLEPLLHTWSLAVEEQFYVLFPLLMFAMRRLPDPTKLLVLGLLAAASFAVDAVLMDHDASAAFYLPLPRAWELMLGALLAVGAWTPGARAREIFGAVGLLLILFSVIFLHPNPSSILPVAFHPCVGAALLILAGRSSGSVANRMLSAAAPAYVGRISYSLYLWHWPLIVGYRLLVGAPSSHQDWIILIAASFVLAALSTAFIERPFRRSAAGFGRGFVLVGSATAMAVSLTLGITVVSLHGLSFRFPADISRLARYARQGEIASMRTGSCFLSTDSNDMKYFSVDRCLTPNPAKKNILILGDSHAAHLWSGLAEAYPDVQFLQATAAGCAPLLDNDHFGSVCGPLMKRMFRDFLPHAKLDGVILAGRWADDIDRALAILPETLRYLGRFQPNLYVVGPIVEYSQPLPRILALGALRRDPELAARLRASEPFGIEPRIAATARAAGASYVSMISTLCANDVCRTRDDDGVPLQFDYGHLSAEGSRFVARIWAKQGLFVRAGAGSSEKTDEVGP